MLTCRTNRTQGRSTDRVGFLFFECIDSKPAARGRRALVDKLDDQMSYGKGLYDPLPASAGRAGVECMTSTRLQRLIVDRAGRVVGVSAIQIPVDTKEGQRNAALVRRATAMVLRLPPMPGARLLGKMAARLFGKARAIEQSIGVTRLVRASRGVCLSAGSFIFNRAMGAHYAPKYRLASSGATPLPPAPAPSHG